MLESILLLKIQTIVPTIFSSLDHKQLRPGVNDYTLVKDFHFDVSMMERLILGGFPYKTLSTQSRMRPEMSELLRDIYPKLQDNLNVVSKNAPPSFMKKSVFFWSHDHTENLSPMIRSKENVNEAKMACLLAKFMCLNKVKQTEITILVAYLSQKKIVRNELKKLDLLDVNYQTIDMYQVSIFSCF